MDTIARGLALNSRKILRRSRGLTIIPAGDSITQAGTAATNGAWAYSSGYAETAIRLAGSRFRQISNAGIAGETSSSILARFQADVIAKSPDVALILAGTNDYVSGMANSAFVTLFNNVQTMVRMCLSANILPVICVPPVKNTAAAESRRAVPFFYRLAEYWGVPLIDLYKLTADPATGNYLSGYSGDGTHPNDVGIAAMAPTVATALRNLDTSYSAPYLATYSEMTYNNPANLLRNGSFAQQSAGLLDAAWAVNTTNATYTVTTTPAAPYAGKEFIYTKSAAGGAYALSAGATFTMVPGNLMIFSGSMDVSGMSSPTGFHLGIDFGGGGLFRPMSAWKQNGALDFSAELIVPAGKTTGSATLFVSDAATYKVRNLTVTDRTAQDAIWMPS